MKFPDINPNLLEIGPIQIRWYSIMYIISFVIAYFFIRKLFKKNGIKISKETYENLLYSLFLGVILGGRLGYVIFYNLPYYLSNPLKIFAVWEGGMSFHGGMLGVIAAGFIYSKKHNLDYLKIADNVVPLAALGLGFGRIGNFINGELYGRVTDSPFGMIFPNTNGQPRHPSQLYEAFFEGFLLSAILFLVLKYSKDKGITFWTFVGGYGFFRFFIEFFRMPDSHLGFILFKLSMGQILCSAMVIASIIGITYLKIRNEKN